MAGHGSHLDGAIAMTKKEQAASRRGAPDRALFPAAGQASRRLRPHRRRRGGYAACGLRSRAHGRRHRRRRAFLSRRSGGHDRQQGAARESLRPCGQRRAAARFPAHARLAEGDRRKLAGTVRARPRRGRGDLRLPAARRRHRAHAGPGDDLDRGVRRACPTARWCAGAAPSPAIAWWSQVRSAMPRSGCCCGKSPGQASAGVSIALGGIICSIAIWCRSRAAPSPRRSAATRPRRWMCPTGWRAISPSSAAPLPSLPRSRSRACPCPTPRGRRWRRILR